jgi:uncharacterized protein YdeI (YjbR/CyaY-like superfamily)
MELNLKTREEWRAWLEENHSTVNGIWLVYFKKISGKPRIQYNDAVEEALCFGWIDGKIKRINEDYYIQWFTPRRPGSRWSKLNISRVRKLIQEGRMSPAGLQAYNETTRRPELIYDMEKETSFSVPDDLINALKDNPVAYGNFMDFPPSSRKLYILWLNNAKRSETRKERITRIVDRAENNIRAGMM